MNKNLDANGNAINAEVEEVLELDEDETDIEAIKAHAKKVEDTNKQLFARAKKAEGFELKDGKWVKPATVEKKEETTVTTENTSQDTLSSMDVITLMNAKVEQEDIPDVVKFAKFENISIAEALKSPIMKAILADKLEERTVAEGTNTGGGKRGSGKVSDESLLSDARKGIYPANDEDMTRLIELRRKNK